MRKLDLLQLSRRLLVASDLPPPPAAGAPVPPPPPPRHAPAQTRDAPDAQRGGALRGPSMPVRGHGPIVPLPRALRPRRRS